MHLFLVFKLEQTLELGVFVGEVVESTRSEGVNDSDVEGTIVGRYEGDVVVLVGYSVGGKVGL